MRTTYLGILRNIIKLIIIFSVSLVLLRNSSQSVQGQTIEVFSIWDNTAVPAVESENDPSAIEVGVKFKSNADGIVTGIRFYKGANNTGTHIGNLWTSSGQSLASATFVNETVSGWQQVDFATPVPINANITYVASYHTGTGYYSLDNNYFTSGSVVNGPLEALEDGIDGGNGVYTYNAQSTFPSQSYNGSNYWVDVVFEIGPDTTPPTITDISPPQGASGIFPDTNATATFNEAIDPATINENTFELRDTANNLVAATVSYDGGTNTATLDPASSLPISTFTATIKGGGTDPVVKDTCGKRITLGLCLVIFDRRLWLCQ